MDLGIPYPGEMAPPEGYEKVTWDETRGGQLVYLACLKVVGPPPGTLVAWALGPYLVLERYSLESVSDSRKVHEYGERLLRKTTPTPPAT